MKNLRKTAKTMASVVLVLDLIGTLLLCVYFCFAPVTQTVMGVTWNFFGYLAAIFLVTYITPRLTCLLDDMDREFVILSTIVACNTVSALVAFDWLFLICSLAMGIPMIYAILKK